MSGASASPSLDVTWELPARARLAGHTPESDSIANSLGPTAWPKPSGPVRPTDYLERAVLLSGLPRKTGPLCVVGVVGMHLTMNRVVEEPECLSKCPFPALHGLPGGEASSMSHPRTMPNRKNLLCA
ncbi:hypothetical protein HPB50_016490 [Hyalomma asiaticum]|uniref:Uncharacterized protein n=1 Tax=Hyalomma asiaticum TaxID=266040 RepID=A0ACB7RL57_HYAAI|nr:hypothetical protein HPB50_016490 [Hyalomma asiaticum]